MNAPLSLGRVNFDDHQQDNVVERLRKRLREVRQDGFDVRIERLEDGAAGWCQIGVKRMIFLDVSQTAREQLAQLDDAVANYAEYEKVSAAAANDQVARPAA
ncbi:hypothetical protein N9N28_09955 [Rubripirellula amarantea]|uniref:Uncharacterized protein n=1 Tax=Rubripirellula amarantea TaxID=2527999 RepID=A0A5C5WSD1_9BACT|nr:hypothetical protein [Rubripirellula amarantea]MDA8744942.1 hypothetical protein [Rubripirellula amarantea]TWT53400.1 hypothetical protein Pla22_10290 [Rubripirellula amarantea]